jgi:glycosyltransferase involved in cell wall biosynthesis
MRILIATTQLPFVWGGAEFHAESLADALRAAGHHVDIAKIPYNTQTPEQIEVATRFCLGLDVRYSSRSKIDRVIGLKFPAYLVPHDEKVLWILHQHRKFYDLWDKFSAQLESTSPWVQLREAIHRWDAEGIPKARAVFANSFNVADRLRRYNGIDSTPLYHPPPSAETFHCDHAEDYILFPSRIANCKRHDLVLEALSKTERPVKVVFVGKGDGIEYENAVKRLSHDFQVHDRCTWLGWVTEEEKIDLYARCLAVLYPPYDEDLGYVTLESMLASKAVLTCTDSGGPLEFVENEKSGLICSPTPEGLAAAMDRLWEERTLARDLGEAGRKRYLDLDLTWSSVVARLLT